MSSVARDVLERVNEAAKIFDYKASVEKDMIVLEPATKNKGIARDNLIYRLEIKENGDAHVLYSYSVDGDPNHKLVNSLIEAVRGEV